ncbi:hypothetical protein WR25_22392 [Diploscapter pachys]|uniref:Transthyretin-like family protein n=1 Tax=Diploscapter pachys TaxID=2018661 RepID=A0A2A2JJM8_9BILA|nr:hypothetical protein WR25_22392 [Diploscapter pachys]
MQLLVVAFALIPLASSIPFLGTEQAVSVRGKLLCNGEPANNVKVKLYEREIVLDKLLSEKFSDGEGRFEMDGHKKEVTTIDPKVNIYHKCGYNGPCYKKISIKIPKNYAAEGTTAKQTFDIGELNLAGAFSGQSLDCLN